jgi:hypothetical protein
MSFFRSTDTPDRVAAIERQCLEILGQLKTMNEHLSTLARRESQLRSVLERDAELERYQSKLSDVLEKPSTGGHVERAIQRAELRDNPFPHAVIDKILPDDLYTCLIRGLPPIELFSDRPTNKQQLQVPFRLAPVYSQRVWRYVTSAIVPNFIVPAAVLKFRSSLDEWIRLNWPAVESNAIDFHSSDGRILLRRRGYRIPPHRDPKWGFLTGILYLARKEDSESWGTQIFSVEGDEEARGAAPHWIDPARCRLVEDVAFRANRLLVFLNSVGAHGAFIPDDAEPEGLERYIFQFRIGPTVESMSLLKASLSDDRRPFWAGKSGDY